MQEVIEETVQQLHAFVPKPGKHANTISACSVQILTCICPGSNQMIRNMAHMLLLP